MESIARILGLLVGGALFDLHHSTPYVFGAGLMVIGWALALVQFFKPRARSSSPDAAG